MNKVTIFGQEVEGRVTQQGGTIFQVPLADGLVLSVWSRRMPSGGEQWVSRLEGTAGALFHSTEHGGAQEASDALQERVRKFAEALKGIIK